MRRKWAVQSRARYKALYDRMKTPSILVVVAIGLVAAGWLWHLTRPIWEVAEPTQSWPQHSASVSPTPTVEDISGVWVCPPLSSSIDLKQNGATISGHGELSVCIGPAVPFTITGARTGDVVVMAFTSQMPEPFSGSHTCRIELAPKGHYPVLDFISPPGSNATHALFVPDAIFRKWQAQPSAEWPPRDPPPGHAEVGR